MSGQPPARSDQKRECFEQWMALDHVLIHLDARCVNVAVPPHLAQNPSLTLKLSYHFQGETVFDQSAITSYLRFSGQYTQVVVPWDAIWGMTCSNGENRVWPEDIPREVLVQMARTKLVSVGKKLFGKKGTAPQDKEQGESSAKRSAVKPDSPKSPTLKRIK